MPACGSTNSFRLPTFQLEAGDWKLVTGDWYLRVRAASILDGEDCRHALSERRRRSRSQGVSEHKGRTAVIDEADDPRGRPETDGERQGNEGGEAQRASGIYRCGHGASGVPSGLGSRLFVGGEIRRATIAR